MAGATQEVIENIEGIKDPKTDQSGLTSGMVAQSWLTERRIGEARLSKKKYADIYSADWLSYLRKRLQNGSTRATILKDEFDISDLMSRRRDVSQRAAVHVRQAGFDGIYYHSRHGLDLVNLALFSPFELTGEKQSPLVPEHEDFQQALKLLDLTLYPNPEEKCSLLGATSPSPLRSL